MSGKSQSTVASLLLEKQNAPFDGVILPIKAQPGSRKNELRGVHDGRLRVCVTQVAEKGKANKAILKLLSSKLELANSALSLLSGELNSQKSILVTGVSRQELLDKIQSALNAKK